MRCHTGWTPAPGSVQNLGVLVACLFCVLLCGTRSAHAQFIGRAYSRPLQLGDVARSFANAGLEVKPETLAAAYRVYLEDCLQLRAEVWPELSKTGDALGDVIPGEQRERRAMQLRRKIEDRIERAEGHMLTTIAAASGAPDSAVRLLPIAKRYEVLRAAEFAQRNWLVSVPPDLERLVAAWPDEWLKLARPSLDSTAASRLAAFRALAKAAEGAGVRAAEFADASGLAEETFGSAGNKPEFQRWAGQRSVRPEEIMAGFAAQLKAADVVISALPTELQSIARCSLISQFRPSGMYEPPLKPKILAAFECRTPQRFALVVLAASGAPGAARDATRAILCDYLRDAGDSFWAMLRAGVYAATDEERRELQKRWELESGKLLRQVEARLVSEAGLAWIESGPVPSSAPGSMGTADWAAIGLAPAFGRRESAWRSHVGELHGADMKMGLTRQLTAQTRKSWIDLLSPGPQQQEMVEQLFRGASAKWASDVQPLVGRAVDAPLEWQERTADVTPKGSAGELLQISRIARPAARVASDAVDAALMADLEAALGPTSHSTLALLLAGRRVTEALQATESGPLSANEIYAFGGAPIDFTVLLSLVRQEDRALLLKALEPASGQALSSATALRDALRQVLDEVRFGDLERAMRAEDLDPAQHSKDLDAQVNWHDNLYGRVMREAWRRGVAAIARWRSAEDLLVSTLLGAVPDSGRADLQVAIDAARWPHEFSLLPAFKRVGDVLHQRAVTDARLLDTVTEFDGLMRVAIAAGVARVQPYRAREGAGAPGEREGTDERRARGNLCEARAFESWSCLSGARWLLSKRLPPEALAALEEQVPDLQRVAPD